MPVELLVGSAIVGGILNAAGSAEEERNRKRKYDQLISVLEDNYITKTEKTTKLDRLSDLYSTSGMDLLNDSSVGLAIGGSANPDTVKSSIASNILSKRAESLYRADEEIDAINRRINEQIGFARMEREGDGATPVLDFLKGGVQGLNIGLSLENYSAVMEENKQNALLFDKYYGNGYGENVVSPPSDIASGLGKDFSKSLDLGAFEVPKTQSIYEYFKSGR